MNHIVSLIDYISKKMFEYIGLCAYIHIGFTKQIFTSVHMKKQYVRQSLRPLLENENLRMNVTILPKI